MGGGGGGVGGGGGDDAHGTVALSTSRKPCLVKLVLMWTASHKHML